MLMRLVWPVVDTDMGVLDLITDGHADYDNVIHRLGFLLAGGAREWEVVPGRRFARDPDFKVLADCSRVLTCVVPVVEAHREAA